MKNTPWVEVWERIHVDPPIWERSFDKGKTWQKVDWSMYKSFPFTSIDPDASWIGSRMLTEDEFKQLYPDKELPG